MQSAPTFWDKRIAVEKLGQISYRLYSERPHRLTDLLRFADHWPARAFAIQGERIVTFDGLLRGSRDKARQLAASGVQAGDHVLLIGWNGPDWAMNYWACHLSGAVPVAANAWWSGTEVSDALELIRPAAVVADDRGAEKIVGGPWRLLPWACHENAPEIGPDAFETAAAAGDENDPAAIIFTSGTQGKPKAVQLAHRSLISNQMMILDVTGKLPYRPETGAGDIGLHTGPLFHIGGLHALHRAVLVGNTLVFGRSKFDPGEVIDLIERHRIVRWSAVPTMVTRILEHPALSAYDVTSLKAITLGGSAISSDLIARVREGLPSVSARIATGYGLSENGGQATTASGKDTALKPGATGRAMPLVEAITVPLPGLPDGEVRLRSPTQMLGYFGATDAPIDEAGWLHTGDLGRIDVDGYLWITGRCKDIIIRGGENIAPAAVEEALLKVDGVIEASVFGIPHRDFGEEVAAVLVITKPLGEDGIASALRQQLASFAVPTTWRLQREPLPVNQTGKIDKALLRSQLLTEVVT